MSCRRVHVVVHGRVQGVGFRWAARDRARLIGVSGTIRNRPDATVEAEIEGPPDRVAAMLTWLAHGPSGADVSRLEQVDLPPLGDGDFRITR